LIIICKKKQKSGKLLNRNNITTRAYGKRSRQLLNHRPFSYQHKVDASTGSTV